MTGMDYFRVRIEGPSRASQMQHTFVFDFLARAICVTGLPDPLTRLTVSDWYSFANRAVINSGSDNSRQLPLLFPFFSYR